MTRRVVIVAVALVAAGCSSPEATRTRGGGAGGDVGNRPSQVKMHEGSRPYWETPVRIGEATPVQPSEQARQQSLPGTSEGSGGGQ